METRNMKKKKEQSSSSSSMNPSLMSEKPISSSSEPIRSLSSPDSSQMDAAESSSAPSLLSMKSDASMWRPVVFGVESKRSTAPSLLSMKSDASMWRPVVFGVESKRQQTGEPSSAVCTKDLAEDLPADLQNQEDPEEDTGRGHLLQIKKVLKKETLEKCNLTFEGDGDQENTLKNIYTEVFITTGESEGSHEERSFRHRKQQHFSELSVKIGDLFKPFSGQEKPIRTVVTKGVAGIGKSFFVQKFMLDWAEEKANQHIDFVFYLAFRELNLIGDIKSLDKLLTEFHPALRSLKNSEDFTKTRVLVILDGLDESRLHLDFENKTVTSVSEVTSVSNLLANLIQGNLLPNAILWITSRPAAANQIPAEFVDMVTEIRGFSDSQKEDYFRKRFSHDSGLADRIISHIHSSQSLDIMCQIPIFCWIASVLFQEIFVVDEEAETPQTLTEMMAHFLFAQTKRRSRKYEKKTEKHNGSLLRMHKEFLLKLGKLAFVQLQKNNLIFYDEDLKECGIDIQEAIIYCGFCNTVLREEEVISQKKVFFFVHLTVQEFFAALFVYDCFTTKNTKELSNFLNLKDEEHTLLDLLKMTVDKVLEKKNGHLDFFLRFILGLMVEHNRRVLQGLLTSPDPSQDTDKKILTYLKAIRRKALPPDSCINLFQNMVEMRDYKVKDEIQEYLKSSDRPKTELTPLHCSALAYMLQVSKDDLEVLDLKSYNTSEEGRRRLIPAVRSSRKAILADCNVTEEWVKHLAFGLKFPDLPLRYLDLSNNDLKDSGVQLLCDGLSSHCCRLENLRLSGCQITEEGCAFLASALQSNPSHLRELDLSYNNPGEAGEKLLCKLRDDPQCKLFILNFEHSGSHRMKPGFKKYALELTLDRSVAHRNLVLSEGNRKVAWVGDKPPDRFGRCQQVLCEQGLDQRCYWEVEVSGPLSVGVTYSRAANKGKTDGLKMGCDDKSWCLVCSNEGNYVLHSNNKVDVSSVGWRSSRVGVYLDWVAGTLSFYRVSSDSRTRLHTYKATFDKPLYPAVELERAQSSASFCQLI